MISEHSDASQSSATPTTQHTKLTEQAKREVIRLGLQTQPEAVVPLVVDNVTSENQQITEHKAKLQSTQRQVFTHAHFLGESKEFNKMQETQ